MAKAALNQETMTTARELKANGQILAVMSVNPGWVPTRMTAGKRDANIEESVAGINKHADELSLGHTAHPGIGMARLSHSKVESSDARAILHRSPFEDRKFTRPSARVQFSESMRGAFPHRGTTWRL